MQITAVILMVIEHQTHNTSFTSGWPCRIKQSQHCTGNRICSET